MSLTKLKSSMAIIANTVIYLAFLLLFTDFIAGLALDLYRKYQPGATDFTLFDPKAIAELGEVQGADLNLYRWYSNKPNYRGSHVQTDQSGFRIDAEALTNDETIGMFGGSTVFSVITSQNGTIPNILSSILNGKQVLNFGVGGYSSGAEIMTFVEAVRAYPRMQTAIFYDGVNELGRAAERQGENGILNSYELIGAPYFAAEIAAIAKSVPGLSVADSNLYYIYKRIVQKLSVSDKAGNHSDYLDRVVDRYFENVKVLSGICGVYNIDCIFTWQPSIFTAPSDALTSRELLIRKQTPMSDYTLLTQKIFEDSRAQKYKVKNISSALDTKSNEHQYYYDWCHLSPDGNRLVAEALAKILE